MRVANSGLPHPLHYRAAAGAAVPVPVAGLPLGTFDGVVYDELEVELGAGDVVAFYSDGLVEARAGNEEYGAERLLRGLEEHAALAAPALGERLLSDLEGFLQGETPADDVTLVVIKIL
jgi:sigma-B regulation protein RsbU (phosphoserine phosphatase)